MSSKRSSNKLSDTDADGRGSSAYDDTELTPERRHRRQSRQPDEKYLQRADKAAGHTRCIVQNIHQATEHAHGWSRSMSCNSDLVRDTFARGVFLSFR